MTHIHVGDCLEVMRGMAAGSVDAVVTDPPYGIRFMGKAWDGADIVRRHAKRVSMPSADPRAGKSGGHNSAAAEAGQYDLSPEGMAAFQRFSVAWAAEALRVLKPGGYLLAFASPRTYHRMAAGVEDAGFEIRDQIMWIHGQGFPKSHNGDWGGTALKPAHEPIVVARKPMIGTYEANYAEHGTGGLNIDACRVLVKGEQRAPLTGKGAVPARHNEATAREAGVVSQPHDLGRWPANVLHDGSEGVVGGFPQASGQMANLIGGDAVKSPSDRTSMRRTRDGEASADSSNGGAVGFKMRPGARRLDTGSAARFFYCAKASPAERNAGLELFEPTEAGIRSDTSGRRIAHREGYDVRPRANNHPTVKPTDLMRYLCRLVTPAGGLVLDPFAGSGSTGRAALMEGFQFVGIELDPEYAAIAEARIRAVQPGLALGDAA